MANLGEIEQALNVLCKNGTKRQNITLLHCTTEYPAPFDEVNLKAMQSLKDAFKLTTKKVIVKSKVLDII